MQTTIKYNQLDAVMQGVLSQNAVLEHYRTKIQPHAVQDEIFRQGILKHKYGIYNKGRRLGATRGAAEAFIEYGLQGKTTLWLDVVQANIRKYFDEFFLKKLKEAGINKAASQDNIQPNEYHFNKQDLTLKFHNGRTDFRSADYPDRIEGFGYDIIFFNEAGLILNDDYLWKNAVMPMMVDNPNSVAIAAGTPKLTLGKGKFFQELANRRDEGREGYGGRRIESHENPYLSEEGLRLLREELKDEGFAASTGEQQELQGKFVDVSALGDFFKIAWFKPAEQKKITRIVRGWDFAATPVSEVNKNPDYTYSCALDVHTEGLTIFDTTFTRAGPTDVDKHLIETLNADFERCNDVSYVIPLDPASAGKVAFEHYKKLLETANPRIKVLEYKQTANLGSKAQRAKPAANLAEKGEISFMKSKKIDHFFFQLSTFPSEEKGVHDDAVDAFAAAVNNCAPSTTVRFRSLS